MCSSTIATFWFGLIFCALRVTTRSPGRSPFATMTRSVSYVAIVIGLAAVIGGGVMHYQGKGPYLVEIHTAIDPAPAVATYLAALLAGGMFLAIGLFVSSLVRNQLVAAVISMAVCLIFIAARFSRPE